jgi:hypothetical protein
MVPGVTASSWSCVIPGKPKPKGNAKKIVRMGRFTKLTNDDAVVAAANNAKAIAYTQRPPQLFTGALVVDVDFVFAIPESRKRGKNKVVPGQRHTQKPDRGNCLKMIEDVLEGIAYADDSAIADGVVRKLWGEVDETRVTVRSVGVDDAL